MNIAGVYQLNPFVGILKHTSSDVTLVRDAHDAWWEQERQLQVAMQVRSGDYFATLATKLDEITQLTREFDDATADEIELIVSDLLYLQRNYSISKKS